MRTIIAAAAIAVALAGAAGAEDFGPMHGRSLDLGPVKGSAYYTVEPTGFRVVATLGTEDTATPIRVVSTLGPGQSVVLSVPGAIGQSDRTLEITRRGDVLSVSPPRLAMN